MRRYRFRFLSFFLLLALGAFLTHSVWLGWMGHFLVQAEAPSQADVVVVLAGDYSGNRIEKAAELVRAKYAPLVLVSGPWEMYGQNEAHLAIAYVVKKGYPEAWFRPVLHQSDSTRDEASALREVFQREKYRKVLVVTSDFHTRRAGLILRRVIHETEIHMVAAPTPNFDPGHWWGSRPGRKTMFQEWTKTLADWVGI